MCFYSSLLVHLKYDDSLFRLTGVPAPVCTRLVISLLSVQIQAHQHFCKPMPFVCDCVSAVVTNTQPLRLWVGLSDWVSAHKRIKAVDVCHRLLEIRQPRQVIWFHPSITASQREHGGVACFVRVHCRSFNAHSSCAIEKCLHEIPNI